MSNTERNKTVVRQFVAALNLADGEAIANLLTDDGRVVTMGTTPLSGTHSKEFVRTASKQILGVFPKGLKITLKEMIAEGDRVSAEAESYGHHISGAVYNNHYHYVFTLRDGKIAEFKEYLDTQLANDVLCGGQKTKG